MANKTFRNRPAKTNSVTVTVNQKSKIAKPFVRNGNVTDARQKIIQKKRNSVTDARDILARMAKKQDARSKLMKIREGRTNGTARNANVQVIGKNILRKTGPDGKISLVTSKAKQTTSDINLAIKQQLGLIQSPRSPKKVVKRTVAQKNLSPAFIRKTIFNDVEYAQAGSFARFEDPDSLYRWVRPELKRKPLPRRTIEAPQWRPYAPLTRTIRPPTAYIDLDAIDDEEMPLVPQRPTISLQGSSRSSNVHSRLDTYPAEQQSHGILSTKTKVVVPAGHRIVVSNLQGTVTEDDIKELFEDIGQLLVARLVRPGVAEVIYKNLKDAQKAVDTYHNRQLDGQPMKCLLVNKRPVNNPTAPAVTSRSPTEGVFSSSRSKTVTVDKLVPDISTIHKVLFQRK